MCDRFNVIHKNGNKLDDNADNLEIKKLSTHQKVIVNNNPKSVEEIIDELDLNDSKEWNFIKDNANYVILNDDI